MSRPRGTKTAKVFADLRGVGLSDLHEVRFRPFECQVGVDRVDEPDLRCEEPGKTAGGDDDRLIVKAADDRLRRPSTIAICP